MLSSAVTGSYGRFSPSFLRNLYTISHNGLYQFTLPPTGLEGSLFSTSSPAYIVRRLFDDGPSDQCEVIPHCILDLHISHHE